MQISLLCMLIWAHLYTVYQAALTLYRATHRPTFSEPNKDITGGPWYTDQEFDHPFIEVGLTHSPGLN